MPAGARVWYEEYLYRRIFPGTSHEDYLDLSYEQVQWMLRIHTIVRRAKRKAKERAAEREQARNKMLG